MQAFCDRLMRERIVTIWGAGYLGYTEILNVQAKGFSVVLWDVLESRHEALLCGDYPKSNVRAAWSLSNQLPVMDMQRLCVTQDPILASSSAIQLICLPTDNLQEYDDLKSIIRKYILPNSNQLLIFTSAHKPGFIDEFLYEDELLNPIHCGIITAFREDWYYEEMLTMQHEQIIGGNDQRSLDMGTFFFEMLNKKCICLPSIKSAEIMVHAQQVHESMSNAFINQLAFAFPDTDIRILSKFLLERARTRLSAPCLGHINMSQISAHGHLTDNPKGSNALSIAQDAQRATLSTLLAYADMLLLHKCSYVLLLGLSPLLSAQFDSRISPSLILADYLHKAGVNVVVHDPSYDEENLCELLPYAKIWTMNEPIDVDAVLLMRDIPTCRNLTQTDLEQLGLNNVNIFIDNVGLFHHNIFEHNCLYHIPGDGKLSLLRE